MRLVLSMILLGLLTACGTSRLEPNSQLVQRAIALKFEQTQQQDVDFKGFEVNRVAITQQEPLVIQDLPAYYVRGTYNLTVKLPKRQVSQQQNPFEVYLQRQKEGKTWRLALPQSTGKDIASDWLTYSIP